MTATQEVVETARRSLIGYSSLASNWTFKRPDHIRKLARILEAVERGDLKRVLVTIPPRHGKSMLCSQFFPAWFMGRNPDKYIITATYGQDLADDFGRIVRDQMVDPWYRAVFDTRLRQDTKALSRLATTKGGQYIGVGVGGAITGRGAHLFLIDDPIKNREEADSPTMLEKCFGWYKAVAYTRLQPGGAVVIIMTRWSEDDLAGRVLREHSHEGWEVVNLKAIEDGQPLWPEAYDLDTLRNIEQTLGMYDFSCLYQQEPLPKEGVIVKREWLRGGVESEYVTTFIGVDPAISSSDQADETAMSVVRIGYGDPVKIDETETIYGHWEFNEQIRNIERLHDKYKTHGDVIIGIEDVAYQKALYQALRDKGLPVHEIRADRDKVRRLMGVSHLLSQGRVRVNTPKLIDQLLRFRGKGEANDLVDAFVYALKMVMEMAEGAIKKPDDRYAGLDARSKQFWKDHHKHLDELNGVGAGIESLIND